jgi:integrase
MGRRARGEGALVQRKDGRWVGVVDLGWVDGRRQRKFVYGATQKEALARMRSVQQTVAAGLRAPAERLTVETHLEHWITNVLPLSVRPSTAENYACIARTHLIPSIGKKRLTRLSPEDVEELLRRKHDAGLSPNTVRLIRAVLRRALRHAERQGKVPRNVAALVDGVRVPKPQKRALSLDEAQRLLLAARQDRLGALYATLLELGLRLGEALGLRWEDVDLEHGNITVVRRLDRTGTAAETKTHTSRRTLHLSDGLVSTLQAHAARQGEEMLQTGELWHETGFVFTSEVGTPLDQSNLRRRFARLCDQAGVGKLAPHELRHSAATLLLAQGVPLHVVSEVLGHSSIRETKDVYGHLVAEDSRRAAEAMNRVLYGL